MESGGQETGKGKRKKEKRKKGKVNRGERTFYLTRLLGNIELKTCRGTGGQVAKNGAGGEGDVSHHLLHF